MRKSCVVFVVSAIVFSAPFAWAQRPQGRGGFGGRSGGSLFLLGQESVQKELALSEDQIKQIDEQLAKQRETFSGLRDLSREERGQKLQEAAKANSAVLASVLDENQLKRFNQIALQQRGGQALADPQVSTALGLTDEQKSRVGEIQSASREEMRSLFQGAAGGDRQETRKKVQEAQAAANEKLLGVLTPEQQTKWKEMLGKPFTGEIRRAFGRGSRGDAGAQRNRPRRNRDATNTGAAIPPNRPQAAAGLFRLASFRADDADDDKGDDAKKADAKRQEKPDAGKSKADKPRSAKAKGHSRDARLRGRGGPEEPRRGDFSRRHRNDRDHAWARVARAMRMREHRPRRPSMAGRGPGPGFAQGSHRDHGPRMVWGGRPAFGGPRHHARFAGFHHHHGHRPPAFDFAQGRRPQWHGHARFAGHRGPMMAHHFGPDRHRGFTMARPDGFRGGHHREMAHWPGRPDHQHHARQAHRHPGPWASFARHRGRGPMHMAGFRAHGPHGPGMGDHGPRAGDDSPSRFRHRRDDDRGDKAIRDHGHRRDRDRDDDDRDDD